MRTASITIITLIILSLFSCKSESRFYTKLVEIDSLLYHDSLDEAYPKFMKLDTLKAQGEGDMAYYCLIQTNIQFRKGSLDIDDSLLNHSIEYFQKTNNLYNLTQSYYYKGLTYFYQGKRKDATFLLKKAEYSSKSLSDMLIKAKIQGALAYFISCSGENEQALNLVKSAVYYSEKTDNQRIKEFNYENLGTIYGKLGYVDSARIYLEKCVLLIDKLPEKKEKAQAYANIAAAYFDLDDKKAEEYVRKSISIWPQANAYQMLGDIYLKRGDVKNADSLWCEGLRVCNLSSRKISILEDIASLRRKEKRFEEVDKLSQWVSKLRDSIEVQQRQDSIKDVMTAFDTNAKVSEAEDKTYSTTLYAIVVSVVAVFGIIVFSYYIMRYRGSIKGLKASNERIGREIERLTRKLENMEKKNNVKKDEVAKLKRQMKRLEEKRAEAEFELKVKTGEQLLKSLEAGGNTGLWTKDEYSQLFAYYEKADPDFMRKVNKIAGGSSSGKLMLILEHEGRQRDEIIKTMNMQPSSYRSLRSRLGMSDA